MTEKDCFLWGLAHFVWQSRHPLLGTASFTIPPSKIFHLFDHDKQNSNRSKYCFNNR
jgi:hypothetical protein